jgi:hypothetical protein
VSARSDVLGPKGAADEISLLRLRRILDQTFGEIPLLDHHLGLLDSRGVLYATHAAGTWKNDLPEMFFGVVRHVIRTQCDGPPPNPDVEGWLAAGRPDETSDPALTRAWDLINLGRYGAHPLPSVPRQTPVDPSVSALDEILTQWPHLGTFVTTYARVERFLDDANITLPPLTA